MEKFEETLRKKGQLVSVYKLWKIFKNAKKKRAIRLCIRAMEKFKNAKKKRAIALSLLFLFGGARTLGVLPAGGVCYVPRLAPALGLAFSQCRVFSRAEQ